jgi:hypothetical protein
MRFRQHLQHEVRHCHTFFLTMCAAANCFASCATSLAMYLTMSNKAKPQVVVVCCRWPTMQRTVGMQRWRPAMAGWSVRVWQTGRPMT